MLSRNFYELGDVVLALHDSLRQADAKQAVFWARELILSEEDDLLHLTMLQAWAIWLGAPAVSWLEAWTSHQEHEIGGCKRMSLVAEFVLIRDTLPKRRAPYPLQAIVMVARGFAAEQNMARVDEAIASNDFFSLYRYLGSEYAKSPASLIEKIASYVETPELFDGFRNAVKTLRGEIQLKHLIAATTVQTFVLPEWPAELQLTQERQTALWLEEWESTIGQRGGRIYSIKGTILPKNHKRAILEYGSATLMMESGCRFWKSGLELSEPESLLVDGLPESWPSEFQTVSHGETVAVSGRNIIKPEQRIYAIWGFMPALRKSWHPPLKKLFDGIGLPTQ
jgi:hypothetical protein